MEPESGRRLSRREPHPLLFSATPSFSASQLDSWGFVGGPTVGGAQQTGLFPDVVVFGLDDAGKAVADDYVISDHNVRSADKAVRLAGVPGGSCQGAHCGVVPSDACTLGPDGNTRSFYESPCVRTSAHSGRCRICVTSGNVRPPGKTLFGFFLFIYFLYFDS